MESMIRKRVELQLRQQPCTLLGVGPVSRLTVEATVELANEHDVDVMLIPSRRQVDSDRLGAGYVEGWNAERFASFVRERDPKGRAILCRDHGGPWQNSKELDEQLDPKAAMESAIASYEEDIEAGFAILHIDPSVGPDSAPDLETTLEYLFELYASCWDMAKSRRLDIQFEVGTEEQSSVSGSMKELEYMLERINGFCKAESLPPPLFVVVQTGTKVAETRNVGSLLSPYRINGEIPPEVFLPYVIQACERHGLKIKQHNTDYLDDRVLSWLPQLGVHSANVAPEYGVVESRAYLQVLEAHRLFKQRDRFIELAYESGKWKKWLLPHSRATERDCAVICGHYVFSTPEFRELVEEVNRELAGTSTVLLDFAKGEVKKCLMRYFKAFRLVARHG
jgi:hypothetical protein